MNERATLSAYRRQRVLLSEFEQTNRWHAALPFALLLKTP
jgi:hypothetical protein